MSGRFETIAKPLVGLSLLARSRSGDERGFLSRLFDAEDMLEIGWSGGVSQVNQTITRMTGTVRGMHFQKPPFSESKLVTCLSGRIMDVAVDIRKGSPTFLRHFATELSPENARSLLIGPGFAHGFQALTDDVLLVYVHSAPYRTDAEGGLDPRDPALAINWPLAVENLSPRDQSHPAIKGAFTGIET